MPDSADEEESVCPFCLRRDEKRSGIHTDSYDGADVNGRYKKISAVFPENSRIFSTVSKNSNNFFNF